MGLFDFFNKPSGRYVTEKKFQANSRTQVELAPKTLKQLREIGVTRENELKLEFFFYANTLEKVEKLSGELTKLNYEVDFGPSQGGRSLFISTGWTTKMKMDENTVASWTKQMCETGYKFDCDFDGWGTTPDQD